MLNLNLLPPEEKTSLAWELRGRAVFAVGTVVGIVAVTFAILLLPAVFGLHFSRIELERELGWARVAPGLVSPDELAAVRSANGLAAAAIEMAQGRKDPAALIAAVLWAVPAGIRIDALGYKSDGQTAELTGFAPSRSSFLSLLRSLRDHPAVAGVSSPVSNVIAESDIAFSVTLTFRP